MGWVQTSGLDFEILLLSYFQVPDAELEGFEKKRVTVGDVAECRTKCRDEELFVCRWGILVLQGLSM